MSELCPSCIQRLRNMADLHMGRDKMSKKDFDKAMDDFKQTGISDDIDFEVGLILREMYSKLVVIERGHGDFESYAGLYNTARSHLLNREFISALDTIMPAVDGVTSEYAAVVARAGVKVQAEEGIKQAERDLSALETRLVKTVAPAETVEKDKSEIATALAEAKKLMESNNYDKALEVISKTIAKVPAGIADKEDVNSGNARG